MYSCLNEQWITFWLLNKKQKSFQIFFFQNILRWLLSKKCNVDCIGKIRILATFSNLDIIRKKYMLFIIFQVHCCKCQLYRALGLECRVCHRMRARTKYEGVKGVSSVNVSFLHPLFFTFSWFYFIVLRRFCLCALNKLTGQILNKVHAIKATKCLHQISITIASLRALKRWQNKTRGLLI